MIGNQVIVKKSGGGQVFSITDNSNSPGVGAQSEAEAGQIVQSAFYLPGTFNSISDSNGTKIPFIETDYGMERKLYFVMPASDVTIN